MNARTTFLSGGAVTALRVASALAVVGVALAACGEMATPTATPMPTPMPTVMPTLAPFDAREAAEQACEALKATSDYDVAYSIADTQEEGALTIEAQVSGDDMRQVLSYPTPLGVAIDETIRKDGVTYTRYNTEDDPVSFSDWRIAHMATSKLMLCFDPEIFIDGVVQEGSSYERRYSSISTSHEDTTVHEFWVDHSGRPSRLRITVTFPNEGAMDGGTTGTSDDAASRQIVITETYSGFGEPNVITAPTLPIAPTPAPTPTINADAISSPSGVIDANGALRIASLVLYRAMRFNVTESMVKESILRDFAARHGSSVGKTHEPDRPIWTIIARGDGVDKYGDAFNTMEAALDKATGEPLMVVTYFGEPDLTVPALTPTPTITPQPRSASMDDAITAPRDPAGP